MGITLCWILKCSNTLVILMGWSASIVFEIFWIYSCNSAFIFLFSIGFLKTIISFNYSVNSEFSLFYCCSQFFIRVKSTFSFSVNVFCAMVKYGDCLTDRYILNELWVCPNFSMFVFLRIILVLKYNLTLDFEYYYWLNVL